MKIVSEFLDFHFNKMFPCHFQDEMGRQFDPASVEFTLEKIIEWGFDQYAEKISDISQSATKELAIEVSLQEINNTWETTELDMGPYKDKGHYKLK